MKPMSKNLQQFYLDYVNNYLTLSQLASDHDLSMNEAELLVEMGRKIHEERVALARSLQKIRNGIVDYTAL